MKLKVIGSSSKGNCYILENENEALIIETGCKFQDVLKSIQYDYRKVVGCVVSHKHGDHAKYIKEFCSRGIKVYSSLDVLSLVNEDVCVSNNFKEIKHNDMLQIGGFKVRPLEVPHDEYLTCFAFQIGHKDMGVLMFATDMIKFNYTLNNLSTIMIEANYLDSILTKNVESGLVDRTRAIRTRNSHCELYTAIDVIKEQNLCGVKNIILLHLSRENADGYHFQTEVEKATGIPTTVARSGIEVELGKI